MQADQEKYGRGGNMADLIKTRDKGGVEQK
jgi:hypothetical protein